jgi:hypothetical protein
MQGISVETYRLTARQNAPQCAANFIRNQQEWRCNSRKMLFAQYGGDRLEASLNVIDQRANAKEIE